MSKPIRAFVAAAPAAQHCAELVARGPDPAELGLRWRMLGERLAEALTLHLAPVLGGKSPRVAVSADATLPPVAAHGLVNRTSTQEPLALAIDGAAMLRLIDRAFGGPGEVPLPLPSTLPPSATLVVGRVAAAIGAALADTLDCSTEELVFQPRAEAPEAMGAAALTLLVSQGSDPAWPIVLALSPGGLAEWLGPRRVEAAARRSADPAAAPFADVPLPLAARLVDMRVPLSTVARLEPGMVLPVAIARAVPLEAGGVVIARGTVGNQDDRIAIKLTHIA